MRAQQKGSFRFFVFIPLTVFLIAIAAAFNYLVDPLWYSKGNRLTGVNYVFNERISKVNLLQRTVGQNYDCLILGSSRVIALHPSEFAPLNCFNFALKGAAIPELLAYGAYARSVGLNPKVVYVGIDDTNFLKDDKTHRYNNPKVRGTPNAWHAFFSADVLLFSMMTLLHVSPDPYNFYDGHFEVQPLPSNAWKPELVKKSDLECTFDTIKDYQRLRNLFPDARVVAYAPPMAPWHQLTDPYARGVLDCELDAFHRVAAFYDGFEDFGIPSPITLDLTNTVDGRHYTPKANIAVAEQLRGKRQDLALEVKSMSLDQYRQAVRSRLYAFSQDHGMGRWWRDPVPASTADISVNHP